MKAIVVEKPGVYALRTKNPDELPKGWARIRTLAAAFCATDLEVLSGHIPAAYPITPGHEWCGIVQEINDDDRSLLGKRVVGSNDVCCLVCSECRSGNWRNCSGFGEIGFRYNGAYAEYFQVPLYALRELPEMISDIQGAMLEPLGVALGTLDKVGAHLGDSLLILGAGSIGLNILAAAKASGLRRITVVERSGGRLAIAEKMGAWKTLASANCNISDELRSLYPKGPDIIIDATGHQDCLNLALDLAPKSGRIGLAGYFRGRNAEINPDKIHIKNLRVTGAGNNWNLVDRCISLTEDGIISTEHLCTERYRLDEFDQAVKDATDRKAGFVKAVFQF